MESIFTCSSVNWVASNPWSSFLAIIVIGLIIIVLVSCKVSQVNNCSLFSFFRLYPEKGLSKQGMFWIAVFLPIGLFLTTGSFVWWGCDLVFSSQGYINFLSISKLPLGLLALALPFGLMVVRIHGTEQTALQIDKVEKQLTNSENNESTRKREKDEFELVQYNEKNINDAIQSIEEIRIIIDEEVSGILLLIKQNLLLKNVSVNIDFDFPKEHIKGELTSHSDILFDYENNGIFLDIVNVAKLLQAGSNIRDYLAKSLSTEKSKGSNLYNEHLWKVNVKWIKFSKASYIIYVLIQIILLHFKTVIDGVDTYPLISEENVKELIQYVSVYESWELDGEIRYFGFSI